MGLTKNTVRTIEETGIVLFAHNQVLTTLQEPLNAGNFRLLSVCDRGDLDRFYTAIDEHMPDVVILQIVSSEINWLKLVLELKEIKPSIRIIVYSSHIERKFILKVMGAGVAGYVVDKGMTSELLSALDVVCGGGVYLSSEILKSPDESSQIPALINSDVSLLSDREREVVRMIGEGLSTKEIAFNLVISTKTVETYRKRIMEKLDIYSIAGLTKFAISTGLTTL